MDFRWSSLDGVGYMLDIQDIQKDHLSESFLKTIIIPHILTFHPEPSLASTNSKSIETFQLGGAGDEILLGDSRFVYVKKTYFESIHHTLT